MNGSKIAKNVAYVLVPIFALLLVLATLGTAIIDEKITETGNEYYGIQIAKGFADTTNFNCTSGYFSSNYNKWNWKRKKW